MTDHLEMWRCPECGGSSFYWHFEAPDGSTLIAKLPSQPEFSGLEGAKARAIAEYQEHVAKRADVADYWTDL